MADKKSNKNIIIIIIVIVVIVVIFIFIGLFVLGMGLLLRGKDGKNGKNGTTGGAFSEGFFAALSTSIVDAGVTTAIHKITPFALSAVTGYNSGMMSLASGTVTIPVTGIYSIEAHVVYGVNGNSLDRPTKAYIDRNGVRSILEDSFSYESNVNDDNSQHMSATMNLLVNDTLEFFLDIGLTGPNPGEVLVIAGGTTRPGTYWAMHRIR